MMSKRDTSTQKMGNTTKNQSSVFKPLIASSLALALGVSVASAAAPTCTSATGAPSICVNGQEGDQSQTLQITWNGINGGSDKIYQPYANSNPISTLTFGFNGASNSGGTMVDMNAYSSFEINGNGNSIKMNDGLGTIEFRFGSATNKTVTLNLNNLTNNQNYALYGNLFIGGGGSNNAFEGTFGGKGISGNVTFGASSDVTSTLNFTNSGSGITGNVTISAGTNNVTFSNQGSGAAIQGNTYIKGGNNIFTFSEATERSLTSGRIYITGTSTTTFDNISKLQALSLGKDGGDNGNAGPNNNTSIIFNNSNEVTISDGIKIEWDVTNGAGKKTTFQNLETLNSNFFITRGGANVAFEGSKKLTINGQFKGQRYNSQTTFTFNNTVGTTINKAGGNAINNTGGKYTFIFAGTTAEIIGGITTTGTANIGGFTQNIINMNASDSNTIQGNLNINTSYAGSSYSFHQIIFNAGTTNKIEGNITSVSAPTTITFSSGAQGSNQVTGNISTNNTTTKITANQGLIIGTSAYDSNTTTQTITATGGGTARNVISAGNLTLNIKTLSATTNGQPSTNNQNIIAGNDNGTTGIVQGNIHIGNVETSSGNNTSDGLAKNIINLASGSLTIDNLIANHGQNHVTSGANTTIGVISTSNKSNTLITSGNVDTTIVTITSEADKYKNKGTNTITIGSTGTNQIGSISASGLTLSDENTYRGTNSITFSGASSNNTIDNVVANAGDNNILVQSDTASIKISNISVSGNGNNIITSSNTTGTNNIGSISASGGTNALTFSGADVSLNISGSIANNAGTNTITASTGTINLTNANEGIVISANGGGTATNTISAATLNINNTSLSVTGNHASTNKNIITATNTGALNFDSISVTSNSNNANEITINNGTLTVVGAILAGSGTNSITSGAANTFANVSSSGGINLFVLNGASSQANKFQNNIEALSGKNIIAITSTGSTNTFQTADNNGAIALTAKGSGLARGQNIIAITDNSSNNTLNFSSISLYNDNNNNSDWQSAQNILSLDGVSTTLTIGSISTTTAGKKSNSNNKNIIAKGILTGETTSNVDVNSSLTTNSYLDDTYAFVGKLTVSEGISAAKGENIISYKANDTVNSTIISNATVGEDGSKTFNTAISGSNTIYLNVAESSISSGVDAITSYIQTASSPGAYVSLAEKAVIAGDIVATGATNIKIVGKANVSAGAGVPYASNGNTNHNQIGILGNIISSSDTNIVLDNAFLAPSAMIVDSGGEKTTVSVGGTQAGNITNQGGTTNIITRFDVDPSSTGISVYNINNQGGTTNVVLQGNLDLGTHLNYAKEGSVNLIFANTNSGVDSFETGHTVLDGNNSQVLGKTYKDGVKLNIQDKTILIGDSEASFLDTYGSYYAKQGESLATIYANRTDTVDTIDIQGLVVGNIYSLASSTSVVAPGVGGYAASGKTYNVTLEQGSAFAGSINLDASTTTAVNIVMNGGSKLILADASDSNAANNFVISSLNITSGSIDAYQLQTETLKQTNTVINIATGGASANNVAERENFRLLTIGGATGTNNPNTSGGLGGAGAAVFMTYVNTNANQGTDGGNTGATLGGKYSNAGNGQYGNLYSDRVIIANIGDNQKAQEGDYYMQFAVDANSKLGSVTYDASNDTNANGGGGVKTAGNIAVLTVVNTQDKISAGVDNKAGITLKTQDVLQGFDRIGGDLVAVQTDINGVYDSNGAYTTYFINNLITRGATEATQEVTASAFATNYDLYLANFNSLNKRMGELRDNDNSQGVWARVFSGAQTNDFSKSKSTYTTVQGGYDYALGMEGANNYIGLAVAYSMSSSKSDLNAIDINGSAKGIEDIKSSAVEVAVYNSYVQDEGWYNDTIAKFSYIMSDFKMIGQTSNYSTNNMAFTLSDEFGYRFKLGEAKEWYIDPQLEVAFGYFNQSDFVQTLGLSSLDGVADSIYTTRARLGSSFGYDFKQFTEGKPIKASVYVGAFYEYDYVAGGDVTLTTNLGGETVSSSAISSDGRVVMNVGTNMTIKENTRIYFDFETSFAGKIRTDYQANVGVRYSFGENTGYTPVDPNKKSITPLKVSDENASEKEEVENTQENTENTSSEVKSETTTEQNTNSTENTTEEKAQ